MRQSRKAGTLFIIALSASGLAAGCSAEVETPGAHTSSPESEAAVTESAVPEEEEYRGVQEPEPHTEVPRGLPDEFDESMLNDRARLGERHVDGEAFGLAVVQGIINVGWSQDLTASLSPYLAGDAESRHLDEMADQHRHLQDAGILRYSIAGQPTWVRSGSEPYSDGVEVLQVEVVMMMDSNLEGGPFWSKNSVFMTRGPTSWEIIDFVPGPGAPYGTTELTTGSEFLSGPGWRQVPPSN